MKTVYYNILLILLIIPSIALANSGKKTEQHTKEKAYHKEFNVNANAMLKVSNSFGNVNITSWDQNKIKVDVLITVNGNDLDKVKEQLDKISVTFKNTSDLVEAITRIDQKRWKKSHKMSFQINYTINVPKTNKVHVSNDYGNISLDEINGTAQINCDYGKVFLGNLNAADNKINIDYCSGSTIEYMKGGVINADYSGIAVAKADLVKLNADYTASVFGNVKQLNFNCDYGSLKIDRVLDIDGSGDYLSTKIENLDGKMNFEASYGALKVVNITKKTTAVNINATYTGVLLKYDSAYDFNFDINTDYGGINLDDKAEITFKENETTSKHYKGFVRKPNSKNTMVVKSSFGGVTIKEN